MPTGEINHHSANNTPSFVVLTILVEAIASFLDFSWCSIRGKWVDSILHESHNRHAHQAFRRQRRGHTERVYQKIKPQTVSPICQLCLCETTSLKTCNIKVWHVFRLLPPRPALVLEGQAVVGKLFFFTLVYLPADPRRFVKVREGVQRKMDFYLIF